MSDNRMYAVITSVITISIASLIGFGLNLASLSDRENIDMRKGKVEACRTIADPTTLTLCLEVIK